MTKGKAGLLESRERRSAWTALALAVALAAPAAADDVLTIERSAEHWSSGGELVMAGHETGRVYLGERRARFDQGGDVSWVLRADQGRLFLLDHASQTYQELTVPVRLEALLPDEVRKRIPDLERIAAPEITVVETGETRTVDGRPAREVILEGRPPDGETSYRIELWMGKLGVDVTLYGELVRSSGALLVDYRGIADRMAAIDGFPLRRRSVVTRPGGVRDVDDRRLVSVETREVAGELYAPPARYRRVPFDPAAWVSIETIGEAPEIEPGVPGSPPGR